MNNAHLQSSSSLELKPPALLYTESPPAKVSKIQVFTILVNLSTSFNGTNGYARILTYSLDEEHNNFMIGQWNSSLIFKIKADGRIKPIHFEMDDFFKAGERTWIAIGFDGDKLIAYQDGKKIKERPVGDIKFSDWSKSYPLVIGSEANGKYSWEGNIYRIAIFDRTLEQEEIAGIIQKQEMLQKAQDRSENPMRVAQGSEKGLDSLASFRFQKDQRWDGTTKPLVCYDFMSSAGRTVKDLGKGIPADLIAPQYFIPYKRAVLQKPYTEMGEFRRNSLDILMNIIGFVPLGFLSSWKMNHRGLSFAGVFMKCVSLGFGISLTIEILQAFLPSRSSDMMDLITNTLGTMIGCFVFSIISWNSRPVRT